LPNCAARKASSNCAARKRINQNLYTRRSKEFLEAGNKRLAGDKHGRQPTTKSKGCGRKLSTPRSCWPRSYSESAAQKKRDRRWGVRYMRYRAPVKLEIILLIQESSLRVCRKLAQLRISRDLLPLERYRARRAAALEDGQPTPRRVWNKPSGSSGRRID